MDNIRSDRWYHGWLGKALILIFIAGEFLLFYNAMDSINFWKYGGDEGLKQVVVPGNNDLILSKSGNYTVFHEYESAVNGRIYSGEQDIPGLMVEFKNKSTGIKIPFQSLSGKVTYNHGGRSGKAVLEFNIRQPGVYTVYGWYQKSNGPQVVLAVGKEDPNYTTIDP